MKICWDTLNSLIYVNHSWRRNDDYLYYTYVDSCAECGEPYLSSKYQKSIYCCMSCSQKNVVYDRHRSEDTKKKISMTMKKRLEDPTKNNMYGRRGSLCPNYKDGRALLSDYSNKWKRLNRHKVNACASKRRALVKNGIIGMADFKEIDIIYKIASDMNARAGKTLFHVDHIIPLSKGGLHHQDNLQILRAEDNLSKADKILEKDGIYYGKEDLS